MDFQPSETMQKLTERLKQIQLQEMQSESMVEEEKINEISNSKDMIDEEEQSDKQKKYSLNETSGLARRSHKISKEQENNVQSQLLRRQKVRQFLMETYKFASSGNNRLRVRQELEKRGILRSITEFYSYLNKFRLKIPQYKSLKEPFDNNAIPCSYTNEFKEVLHLFYEMSQKAMGNDPQKTLNS